MITNSLELAHTIVDILEERKGEDIVLLDLSDLEAFTDYFVICSGPSVRTLKALADEIQKTLKERFQIRAHSIEGEPQGGWVLIDYSSVVIHIFSPAVRAYYRLEDLWEAGSVLLRIQ